MNKQQFIMAGIIGIALYLLSTGLSFGLFSYLTKNGTLSSLQTPALTGASGAKGHFAIDPSIPRTQACPLNGKFYTKQEEDVWSTRRPMAVMIENHTEARPQSGLTSADIVYEAVAEGGITRFMGVYYCGAAAGDVALAPVRSARTYFVNWVSEYDALYTHVGGAGNCDDDTVDVRAKALCQIDQYKIKNMDQFGLNLKTTDKKNYICVRQPDRLGHEVATEHTMVCYTDGLYKVAAERGWTNVDTKGIKWDSNFVPWKFKDDVKESDRVASFSASFVAWKGYEKDFGVRWDYDKATNSYLRFMGGVPHTDLETKKQIAAKNVVIIFAKEIGPVDEHAHLLYNNIGSGDGLVFQDGKVTKVTWKKPDRLARTKFYDQTGKEVSLNRGQIWIEMLPTGTPVTY